MEKNYSKEENIAWIKKIVVWITLLFMPFSTYATPINGITYGDFLLIIGIVFVAVYIGNSKINLNKVITWQLIFYIFLILLNSCIFWIVKFNGLSEGLLSVTRYILYIFWVSITAKEFFDFKYAYKVYKILALAFAIYCMMQFVAFHLFNKVLPINVLGLPKVSYIADKYSEETIEYYINGTTIFRPYSVFVEPAYFAVYEIPILYLILNDVIKKEKNIIKYGISIIITVALIMTSSTTGYILLVICWFKPILSLLRKSPKTILIVLILTIILGLYLFNSSYFKRISTRIINTDGTLGKSITGRFGNMHILYDGTMNFMQIVFGQGMWTETEYLPSYGRIIVSFGIIGLIAIILMFFYDYIKANKIGKIMILLLMVMCFGTNTFFNISSVLILTIIYSNMKKELSENYNN